MQTELFSAKSKKKTVKESLDRLTLGKAEDELVNIHQVYVVDDNKKLLARFY